MVYYMGDPGFFSIIKALGSSALGLVPGGAVAGRVLGGASRISTIARKAGGTILRHPVISAAGGAAAAGLGGAAIGRMGMHGGPMKGFHINKHGKMVRNRRMRVTNPRALRRAIRAAHGFAPLARKVLVFTAPRQHKGHMDFRKKKTSK